MPKKGLHASSTKKLEADDIRGGLRMRAQRKFSTWDHYYIHVSEPLTREPKFTFISANHQIDKQPPLVRELFGIPGVANITLEPYLLGIQRARVYEWEEILAPAKDVIERHYRKGTINRSKADADADHR